MAGKTCKNMGKNMEKTKEVNGLTLVFDEDINQFVLPEKSTLQVRLVYDFTDNKFVEFIMPGNGGSENTISIVEKSVENSEFKYTERVYLKKIPKQIQADIEHQKMLFKKQLIISANGLFTLTVICLGISIIWFFVNLAFNIGPIVSSITAGAAGAFQEIGVLLSWLIGGIMALFVVTKLLPLLFAAKIPRSTDHEEAENEQQIGDKNVTNIYVNNAKNVTGGVSNAQDYINQRNV